MYLARRDVIVNFVRKSLLDGNDIKLESGELVSINKILKYLVMLYNDNSYFNFCVVLSKLMIQNNLLKFTSSYTFHERHDITIVHPM